MTDEEIKTEYNEMLDELYPLDGLSCCPLSLLLERGDPVAYQVGLQEHKDEH